MWCTGVHGGRMNFLLKAVLLYAISIPVTKLVVRVVDDIVPPSNAS